MWGNYALSLYRTLSRHRLYAILNTFGLALGIAVCTILLLVVRFETSFDKAVPGADEVYRINEIVTFPGRPVQDEPSTPGVLLPALMTDFPQIRSGARLMDQRLVVRSGPQQAYERVVMADPTIFDIFPLPFVAGSSAHALDDTTSLVVSQSMARKYFGAQQAVGRRLTLVIDGVARDYRVTGVMQDLPANSHLVLDFLVRYSVDLLPARAPLLQRWGSSMMFTYIRASRADAQAIQAGLPAFVDRHVGEDMSSPAGKAREVLQFRLKPLTGLHFADAKTEGAFKPGADPLFVGALGVMGVVTLLIALVNYVSLATARSGLRAREVAVRKVMGATRRALILQFVGESVVLALVAGLIAAAVAEAALPAVSAMLAEPITLRYFGHDGVALPLIGLCVVVGLLAGIYPAIVLSGFRPASVLASARTPGGGRAGARVRQVMAVGQFAIAICLMICTSVIFTQTEFVRHADLGFRRDGLIIVHGLGEQQVRPDRRSLLEAFRNVPGVVAATVSDRRPATDEENNTGASLVSNPAVRPTLTMERMSSDYMRTYGLKMVAGRPLGLAQRLDDKAGIDAEIIADRGLNIMVNASAARALGFPNPAGALGQRLRLGKTESGRDFVVTIVGVTQDVRFLSPHTAARPQVYLQDTGLGSRDNAAGWTAAVRVPDAEIPAATKRLEAVWRSMEPGTPFQAETVQAALKPYYDPDARRAQLFAVGAVLSAAIACLGLYGLAAFNTSRRFKEIGIRKTLGASTTDVMRLLVGEFLKPVLWANLIAWPLGFLAMRAWLAGFDQRIALSPIYFLAPSLAALIVAVLTVAEQAFRVARAEPAKALRYE